MLRIRAGMVMPAIGILLLVAGLAGPGAAQMIGPMGPSGPGGRPGPPGAGPGRGGEQGSWGWTAQERPIISMALMHARDLGLTAEQESKLRTLRTEFEKEALRRTAEIRIAEADLGALLDPERWDLGQIEAKVKQIGQLQADLRMARIRALDAGRSVLTPDQLRWVEQLQFSPSGPAGPSGPPRPRRPGTPAAPGSPPAPQGPPAPGVPQTPRS
jgi:Spy/CpxP family protein refolding chaperone